MHSLGIEPMTLMFSDSWYTDRFMIMQITKLVDSLLQILKRKTKAEWILLTYQ